MLVEVARRAAWAGVLFAVAAAHAASGDELKVGRYAGASSAAPVLEKVPFLHPSMGYKNLGERLQRMGIRVEEVQVERMTAQDEKDDPQSFRRGDLLVTVDIAQPPSPVTAICPISTRFRLTQRGARWFAHERTGNFLLNGYGFCKAPA